MKYNKTIIRISVLLIIAIGIFFITSLNSVSYADDSSKSTQIGEEVTPTPSSEKTYTFQDALEDAIQFLKGGKEQSDGNFAQDSLDGIFNALFIVGSMLTLIVGGVLGIKFMVASAEDKAKIKESMIPYVLGCVVIFGAVGIWKLVISILNGL